MKLFYPRIIWGYQCVWCGKKFPEMSRKIMIEHLFTECQEFPGWAAIKIAELDMKNKLLLEDNHSLLVRIEKLEQDWTAIKPDSWNFCPHPCEVRYDAHGKPTHFRLLLEEGK